LADVSGVDLNAGSIGWSNDRIGALLTRLARSVANEQRQPGVRLAIQKFADQLHPEKAGCAGN
jgi:hypothetical protein